EDCVRALAAHEVTEESVVLREDERDPFCLEPLETPLSDRSIERSGTAKGSHSWRHRNGGKDLGALLGRFESDVATVGLSRKHDFLVAAGALLSNFVERALYGAVASCIATRLSEVMPLDDDDVPATELKEPKRGRDRGAPLFQRARQPVIPDHDPFRCFGAVLFQIAEGPFDP